MKANVFTVSIPTPPCKSMCPYCISDMTFPVIHNERWFNNNLQKAVKLAERLNVSHCLITAKGEPLDNPKMLKKVLYAFSDFPIEVQTHYRSPCFQEDIVEMFYDTALNVLSISIDDPKQFFNAAIWHQLATFPWIKRAAIVLTNRFKGWQLTDFIRVCRERSIKELTIRNPTIPANFQENKKSFRAVAWINENTSDSSYIAIIKELTILRSQGKAHFIRDLQFGAEIWDIEGVSFVAMNYCVENQNGETIRSLIYQSDGNFYTTWNYRGSIMF